MVANRLWLEVRVLRNSRNTFRHRGTRSETFCSNASKSDRFKEQEVSVALNSTGGDAEYFFVFGFRTEDTAEILYNCESYIKKETLYLDFPLKFSR